MKYFKKQAELMSDGDSIDTSYNALNADFNVLKKSLKNVPIEIAEALAYPILGGAVPAIAAYNARRGHNLVAGLGIAGTIAGVTAAKIRSAKREQLIEIEDLESKGFDMTNAKKDFWSGAYKGIKQDEKLKKKYLDLI